MSAKSKAVKVAPKTASATGSKSNIPQVDSESVIKLTEELAVERRERNYFQIERVYNFSNNRTKLIISGILPRMSCLSRKMRS